MKSTATSSRGPSRKIVVRNVLVEGTMPWHSHEESQLAYTSDGVITVQTEIGLWVVPPQRAVWIPGSMSHTISARRKCRMQTLYAHPTMPNLPNECCVVAIDALTRGLLVEASMYPADYPIGGPEERLISVILDRLPRVGIQSLSIPSPSDSRLQSVCAVFWRNPADTRTLEELAAEAGMTARTASRLFQREMNMTFVQWRQQLRLLKALQLLGEDISVTKVASSVGYQDVSAFITMFRNALGETPSRYFCRETS